MPRVKQPASLQAMAADALLDFVVKFCDQLGATGSSVKLQDGISVIKEAVCNRIPWPYLAEFCTRFLDEFLSKERDEGQHKAALAIIMDSEIVGLQCRGEILQYLDPRDGHRFQRPVELDVTHIDHTGYDSQGSILESFNLNELTTLIFPRYCSDSDLAVIGKNCSKLEVLKVRSANEITDEGLRALSPCSKLRVIDIADCDRVSHIGVNHLLSVHKNLEEICCGSQTDFDKSRLDEPDDFLSRFDSAAACLSLKSLWIHGAAVTSQHLRSIAAKFPNLTTFGIEDSTVGDLGVLNSLNKLETIELKFASVDSWYQASSSSDIERTWVCLQELLLHIGKNIKTLKFSCWDQGFFWYQEGVDFIFENCPNIEHFKFDHGSTSLVIPQFKKLKELIPTVPINFESSDIIGPPVIEFDKLLNLESLTLIDFGVNFERVKSIMLDDVKFPKLTELKTDCLTTEEVEEIKRIAKSNNIDFKIINLGTCSWYSESMYRS